MKTITIQIGNSDDKLTQKEWSEYVLEIATEVALSGAETHFFACSAGSETWQNAAWVIVAATDTLRLMATVAMIRLKYKQDSVAWTEGETQFV